MGIGAAISGGSGVISAIAGGDAIDDAIDDAKRDLSGTRTRVTDRFTPFSEAGRIGLDNFTQGANIDLNDLVANIQNDPVFQFRLKQGLDAVEGSAAATGNLRSGKTLESLTEFSQGIASNEAANAVARAQQNLNNNLTLANLGFNADQVISNADLGISNQLAELTLGAGNNRAATIGGALGGIGKAASSFIKPSVPEVG